jgi:glycopeptide antibiotics resistance protein
MSHALRQASPGRLLGTGTYALLTLGFLIFVVYGSLVPFHYTPLSWEETLAAWHKVCARPLGIDSRMDFATNVLLFIPLSFLLVGTFSVGRGRLVAIAAAVVVIPFCSALSASIEFTQLWFPPRVSSLNDVLAETLGAVLGSLLWIVAGGWITDYVDSVWDGGGSNNLAMKLIPAYLAVLIFVQVMPLDLTINPVELYHKWKAGRVVLIPFTTEYGSTINAITKNASNMLYFAPLGWLLSLWPGQRFASGWRVLAAGAAAAGAVEFMQLFVMTRYFDATDIVTGTAAVWLAWMLSEAWKTRGGVMEVLRSNPVALRVGLLAVWFVVVATVHWYPVDVITAAEAAEPSRTPAEVARREKAWFLSDDGRELHKYDYSQTLAVQTVGPFLVLMDWHIVTRRWQETSLVPLEDLFPDTDYHAFDELVQKTLLFMPLGALLVPVTGRNWQAIWRAAWAGFCLSSLFAAGQLFVPTRLASISAVVIETVAAALGFALIHQIRVLMESRPATGVNESPRTGVLMPASLGAGVFIPGADAIAILGRTTFLPDDPADNRPYRS